MLNVEGSRLTHLLNSARVNTPDMKVKWFFRAKSTDLEKVIKDKDCQSIVLVGHGSLNCWQATDMLVSNLEVSDMVKGIPKKTGEWLQLSCGVEDAFPVRMGELVMERKKGSTHTLNL